MKFVNPPDSSLSLVLLLSVPLEPFSSATAHARHADEIAHTSLLCTSLFTVLLHSGTRKHEVSHSGRIFTAIATDYSCFACPGQYTGVQFVDCPSWETSDLSCVSTGPRNMCLGSSLGPSAERETVIPQDLLHSRHQVMLPGMRAGTGAVEMRAGESSCRGPKRSLTLLVP